MSQRKFLQKMGSIKCNSLDALDEYWGEEYEQDYASDKHAQEVEA